MKLTRLVGVAALSRLLPGLVGVTGGSTGGLVWFPANIHPVDEIGDTDSGTGGPARLPAQAAGR